MSTFAEQLFETIERSEIPKDNSFSFNGFDCEKEDSRIFEDFLNAVADSPNSVTVCLDNPGMTGAKDPHALTVSIVIKTSPWKDEINSKKYYLARELDKLEKKRKIAQMEQEIAELKAQIENLKDEE